MEQTLKVSSEKFTKIFWSKVLEESDCLVQEREALAKSLKELDSLRCFADYNTGSISLASSWCLYNLVKYFRLERAIEVGTFIGKSTMSIASAMDRFSQTGEIFTCDISNSIEIPAVGKVKINQFGKKSSSEMLSTLSGSFDFLFLDGRLTDKDINFLSSLLTPNSIIALDDFEGIEKGVFNVFKLRELNLLRTHLLIYPENEANLKNLGFTSNSLIAVLFPISRIELTAQG